MLAIIDNTNNIKHKCNVSLLYSGGLRRGELINLKIVDEKLPDEPKLKGPDQKEIDIRHTLLRAKELLKKKIRKSKPSATTVGALAKSLALPMPSNVAAFRQRQIGCKNSMRVCL